MKVFVTGANGFIGSNLVKGLVKSGHKVISLVLPGTSTSSLQGVDTEIVYGNILHPESFNNYLDEVDALFHLAAKVSDWGRKEEFNLVNVEGTKRMLKECIKKGVRRFVFMSSLAVHSPKRDYIYADESAPRDHLSMPYAKSKIEGENLVMEAHEKGKIEGVIVRPGFFPFGPWDMTSFYPMAQAMKRGFYGYINGGRAYVCTSYVENLAYGLILAGTSKEASGECFVISDNAKITWRELSEKMAHSLKVPPPRLSIPLRAGVLTAGMLEFTWRLLGLKNAPPLTLYRVRVAGTSYHFISKKAEKLLGYTPLVNIDEGLRRTCEWFFRLTGSG